MTNAPRVLYIILVYFSICILWPPTPLAAVADTLTVSEFQKMAREGNLELKIVAAEASASKAESEGIALPAPMFGWTRMSDVSGSNPGFEITQAIPFPTRIWNDREARGFESQSREAARRASAVEIVARARLLYFQLWRSQERLALLIEKKRAIEQHLKLVNAGVRSDSFQRIHLIKTESEMDLLENDIFQAESELKERRIAAALYVNLDPSNFQPRLVEPPLGTEPSAQALISPLRLESIKLDLERWRAREREAQADWLPEFGLRYREMGGTAMTPRYSEVMVSASLPFLFFWGPHRAAEKAGVERTIAELKVELERRKISGAITSLHVRAQALRKQLDQLREKIMPRAERRVRFVHNVAPRDLESLEDHRESMASLPELRMKALEIRGLYEEVVAELEQYSSFEDTK